MDWSSKHKKQTRERERERSKKKKKRAAYGIGDFGVLGNQEFQNQYFESTCTERGREKEKGKG
jgi:hypothetical protein